MFESWSPWAWVAAGWAELILAYLGFLLYLGLRARRRGSEEEEPSND